VSDVEESLKLTDFQFANPEILSDCSLFLLEKLEDYCVRMCKKDIRAEKWHEKTALHRKQWQQRSGRHANLSG
jgi:hypothetical protein